MVDFNIVNDPKNDFGIDANIEAKEMGRFENLGEHVAFGYLELAERVKNDYENLMAIQMKKEKSQKAYEETQVRKKSKTNLSD